MTNTDVLRPVDDESRRRAKTLMRLARHAALACLEPGTGAPLVSQVNIATDIDGSPCFLISQLSAHFGALENDSRCSILFGLPGKGDPAAHARITVNGRVQKVTDKTERTRIRDRFLRKHPKSELYADFGDFAFWRQEPDAASLNAGFGKAYEMSGADILVAPALVESLVEMEAGAVEHMNDDHADAIALYATVLAKQNEGNWTLSGLDPEGLDLANGDQTARLWFEPPLTGAAELRPRLVELAKHARAQSA